MKKVTAVTQNNTPFIVKKWLKILASKIIYLYIIEKKIIRFDIIKKLFGDIPF